jgi:hypothetical protein
LILIKKAIFASGSTKKLPAFFAARFYSIRVLSAVAYSLAYFSAFLAATALFSARNFFAASLATLAAASCLASRAVFF